MLLFSCIESRLCAPLLTIRVTLTNKSLVLNFSILKKRVYHQLRNGNRGRSENCYYWRQEVTVLRLPVQRSVRVVARAEDCRLDIVCVTIVDSLEHILEPQYDVLKRYTLLLSIVPTC